jgi:hypothetical protein
MLATERRGVNKQPRLRTLRLKMPHVPKPRSEGANIAAMNAMATCALLFSQDSRRSIAIIVV